MENKMDVISFGWGIVLVFLLVLFLFIGVGVGSSYSKDKVKRAIECVKQNPQANCFYLVNGVEE